MLVRKALRRFDIHAEDKVAAAVGIHHRHALLLECKGCSRLRSLGDIELLASLKSRYLDLSAKSCLGYSDRHFAEKRVALALKGVASSYAYHYVNVARGSAVLAVVALSSDNESLAVIYSRRDIDRHLLVLTLHTRAATAGARIFDVLTRAATGFAGSGGLELHTAKVLHYSSLSRAATGGAGFNLTVFRAASVTLCALFVSVEADVLLAAEHSLLKIDS